MKTVYQGLIERNPPCESTEHLQVFLHSLRKSLGNTFLLVPRASFLFTSETLSLWFLPGLVNPASFPHLSGFIRCARASQSEVAGFISLMDFLEVLSGTWIECVSPSAPNLLLSVSHSTQTFNLVLALRSFLFPS